MKTSAAILILLLASGVIAQLNISSPFFVAGVLKPAAAAGGGIALDQAAFANVQSVGSLTFSHTNAGANRIIIFGGDDLGTGSTSTYTNVYLRSASGTNAFTKLVSTNDGCGTFAKVSLWYYLNPPTGSNTIAAIVNGTGTYLSGFAVSFTGVHQSTPTRSNGYKQNDQGDATDPGTVTVTDSQANDMVITAVGVYNTASVIVPDISNNRVIDPLSGSAYGSGIAWSLATGSSTAHNWTNALSIGCWSGVGVSLVPAP